MKEAYTTTAHFILDEEDILHIKFAKGTYIDIEDAINHYAVCNRLAGDRKVLVLIDIRENFTVTDEARKYAASEHALKPRIATAIVTKNHATILAVNLFIKINRPVKPMKLFSSKEKGLKWLRSFKE